MITKLLQTTLPVVDEQKLIQTTDSLRTVTEEFVNVLKTDPHTAVTQLVHSAIEFGLKVLAAIIIYVIGLWLIKRVKKMMNRNFERKHTDNTIARFTNSISGIDHFGHHSVHRHSRRQHHFPGGSSGSRRYGLGHGIERYSPELRRWHYALDFQALQGGRLYRGAGL